ncbi:MAG: hypothetical protein M1368_01955 [Thaumarchaeota archaeon]|nr:hypothetical protein [Nitrososphaerota archaeon]
MNLRISSASNVINFVLKKGYREAIPNYITKEYQTRLSIARVCGGIKSTKLVVVPCTRTTVETIQFSPFSDSERKLMATF